MEYDFLHHTIIDYIIQLLIIEHADNFPIMRPVTSTFTFVIDIVDNFPKLYMICQPDLLC